MEEAFAVGIEPAAFWRLTPREFWAAVRGSALRERRELQQQVTAAYFNAAWARAKKLPRLRTVLKSLESKDRSAKPLTPAEMRQKLTAFGAMFGAVDMRGKGRDAWRKVVGG